MQKHQRALRITIEFERARREGARAVAAHPATRRHHEPILRLPSALAESTLGASGTGGTAVADGGRPGGGSCMSVARGGGGCGGFLDGSEPAPHNRYRDGAPLPGFFWLFATSELVSNKP